MAVKSRKRSAGDSSLQRESLRALQDTVETVARRLYRDRLLLPGTIVFRAAAGESAGFALCSTDTGIRVEPGCEYPDPLLEVMGDPRRIDAIVRGRKDARMQFFAGGIRIRGDMHYLSRLGMELGFLKKPLV